jgi:hypothetical protein
MRNVGRNIAIQMSRQQLSFFALEDSKQSLNPFLFSRLFSFHLSTMPPHHHGYADEWFWDELPASAKNAATILGYTQDCKHKVSFCD